MANDAVAPTSHDLETLDHSAVDSKATLQAAQDGDASDRSLTIKQAVKKYKKAVFWAMILSTSLIMEGYDVVIVGYDPSCAISRQPVADLMARSTTDHLLLRTNAVH